VKPENMKILFLVSDLEGGAGIAARRQARALKVAGINVDIESLDFSKNPAILRYIRKFLARLNRKFEYEVINHVLGKSPQYRSTNWLPLRPLFWINLKQYDIIHLHWINSGLIGLNHLKHISKCAPIVWTMHSLWPLTSPDHHPRPNLLPTRGNKKLLLQRFILADSNFSKYVSSWVFPTVFAAGTSANQLNNISVIHNPMPQEAFANLGQEHYSFFSFVCAGDVFDPRKGLKDLLYCWIESEIWKDGWSLMVVGPVHPSTQDSGLMALSQIANVKFVGALRFNEVARIYSRSKAQVVSSYEETFGQVIIEPLCAGTPVLVRGGLGCLEDFKPLNGGIIETDFTPTNFKQAVQAAASWVGDRQELQQTARKHFGEEIIAEQLVGVYKSILGAKK
jgi:glycosyltransferase involved in cell wall biosynthesis